jgi:hypothetical protein
MSSEPNLSRINDYQNHIEELHRSKIRLEKSISDVANKKKINDAGGDNDSINSVESLNNYLDVKVRVIQFFFGCFACPNVVIIYHQNIILT